MIIFFQISLLLDHQDVPEVFHVQIQDVIKRLDGNKVYIHTKHMNVEFQ